MLKITNIHVYIWYTNLTCSKSEKYFSFHSFLSRRTLAISRRLIRNPSGPVTASDAYKQ